MLGIVKKKKKKNGIKYALIVVGKSRFRNKKFLRLPFQVKKTFNKPQNPQNKNWRDKFQAKKWTKCGLVVKRTDKGSGWGQKLVLKVEYKIKNGKNIKKYCKKFNSTKGRRYVKRIQKPLE